MVARILLTTAILVMAPAAQAAWDIGAGLEDYRWTESPESFYGTPRESGMRSGLFASWTQEGDRGALFAWRAKLYGGTVSYDTYLISSGAPVSTRTDYGGAASEGQLVYRNNLGANRLDYLGGLGLDSWRRSIRRPGSDQIEDYYILFMRAGLRLAEPGAGLHGECGIKYPLWTREDAHLTSLGYTSNPTLSPEGEISGYAELGYRINERYDVVGYYDSWRFGRSADVITTDAAGTIWLIQQPKSRMDALGIKLSVSF